MNKKNKCIDTDSENICESNKSAFADWVVTEYMEDPVIDQESGQKIIELMRDNKNEIIINKLKDENTDLREQLSELADRLDQAYVQLAGCGVAAMGGISKNQVAKKGSYGWSASYEDVLNLRKAYDEKQNLPPCIKRLRNHDKVELEEMLKQWEDNIMYPSPTQHSAAADARDCIIWLMTESANTIAAAIAEDSDVDVLKEWTDNCKVGEAKYRRTRALARTKVIPFQEINALIHKLELFMAGTEDSINEVKSKLSEFINDEKEDR